MDEIVMSLLGASMAWPAYNLNAPERGKWTRSGIGWVCEVWQSAYGHRASKKTWLYWRGNGQPEEMDWSQPVGTHQIGFQDQRGKDRNKPTLSPREANATPIRFRDALLRLACMANDILAHFITAGVVEGNHQVQQLLDTHFDRALAACEPARLIELEPMTRLLSAASSDLIRRFPQNFNRREPTK